MDQNPQQSFQSVYQELNEKQRSAVDKIFGPVMVVAGPGTGKTQMLSARIGHILNETDYQPQNILCLTYTEAGAYNMRNRLKLFIGPEAYKVNIYTFHGFCNKIIQEHREYFGGYEDLQPLDDLERIELIIDVIDGIPNDSPLKRFKGNVYFDQWRLLNLFKMMKQENWSVDFMLRRIQAYEAEIPTLDEFVYKRKYKDKKPGDLNSKGQKELEKMEVTREAIALSGVYNQKMLERKRYDYEDMILWVIRAFEEEPSLLQEYREQFQFFLVDEYQDTNGAQNTILNNLAGDPADVPNVFVVGDDDQSIFRFQGASLTNILDFSERYQDQLSLVLLDQNYRSSQKILDVAGTLIRNNPERLVNKIEGLTKHLVAKSDNKDLADKVCVWDYQNEYAEEIGVYTEVKRLIDSGVALSDIAVIYRKHKDIERLRKKFDIEKIPYNIRRRENVLEHPLIIHILNILRYVHSEINDPFSADYLLAEILHYPYFGISALDIGRLAAHIRRQDRDSRKSWREYIADTEVLETAGVDVVGFSEISSFLEGAIEQASTLTVQNLLEFIVDRGGFLEHVLNTPDFNIGLRILSTLYDFLKDRTAKRYSRTLDEFVTDLGRMQDHELALPVNIEILRTTGINLVTAHSAKGLEFPYVFIIGANEKKWEKSRGGNRDFKIPPNLTDHLAEDKESEERRLFYVAMTRAEKHLYITFANKDLGGKDVSASQFIAEIEDHPDVKRAQPKLDPYDVDAFMADMLRFGSVNVEFDDDAWLDEILKDFKLSPTALNKYLDCPVRFYYENLLRIPRARSAGMGFGSAVHYALEQFFNRKQGQEVYPDEAFLMSQFQSGMEHFRSHFTDKEFEDLSAYGRQIIPEYLRSKLPLWKRISQSRTEYPVRDVAVDGVPVTGKFDRVDVFGREVHIIDYKTGKLNRAKLKGPEPDPDHKLKADIARETDPEKRYKLKMKLYGADYWRQIVFYKILMDVNDRDNWHMTRGAVSFIEAVEQYDKDPVIIDVGYPEETLVREQIRETYMRIMKKEFNDGCQRDYCQWCTLMNDK